MTVHEPATLLTDYLLAILAAGLAWRLPSGSPAMRWWRRAMALTSLSALVGGSYHGFAPDFPASVVAVWWTATLLIICLMSAAMALSLLHELAPCAARGWTGVIALKLVASVGAVLVHSAFVVAIVDYGLTMLAWTTAALLLRRAWRGWMLAAIALSALAAAVQQMHWGLSRQFNHNDLYHVIQALALVGFYQAGRRFTRDGS